jgi:hypothetical protein
MLKWTSALTWHALAACNNSVASAARWQENLVLVAEIKNKNSHLILHAFTFASYGIVLTRMLLWKHQAVVAWHKHALGLKRISTIPPSER